VLLLDCLLCTDADAQSLKLRRHPEVTKKNLFFFPDLMIIIYFRSCSQAGLWLSGTFRGSSGSFDTEFSGWILDQYGRPWFLPLQLRVVVQGSVHSHVSLSVAGQVQNAFEIVAAQNGTCPSGSVCCVDAKGLPIVRTLLRNATLYDVSASTSESLVTTLSVSVSDNTTSLSVAPAFVRTFSAGRINPLDTPSNLLCGKNNSGCFFVPSGLFSTNINSIGISDASFAAIAGACTAPVGAYVAISNASGADLFDQFASFRLADIPVASSRPDCVSRSLNSSLAVFDCSKVQTGFGSLLPSRWRSVLRPGFGVAFVRTASVVARRDVLYGGALVEVQIVASDCSDGAFWKSDKQQFVVHVESCTMRGTLLVSPRQKILLSCNERAWLSFVVATEEAKMEGHSCRVAVSSFGIVQSFADAVVSQRSARKRDVNARCTIDQVAGTCAPINCWKTYNGTKSFYNTVTGLCETTAVCTTSLYNPTTNLCEAYSTEEATISNAEAYTPLRAPSPPASIVCIHGVINETDAGCKCDFGWSTDFWTQEFRNFVFCNVSAQTMGAGTGGETPSLSVGFGLAKVLLTVVIIVCVAVGVVLIVVVACCVCKARKRQRLRRAQTQHSSYMLSNMAHLQEQTILHPPVTTCAPADVENSFNFVLPSSLESNEGRSGESSGKLRRCSNKRDLKKLCIEETRVFFRVDETSFVPGVLVLLPPFVEFRVEQTHAMFAMFPRTPLTQQQAMKYIFC
jgi:hypothetical protein